MVKKVRSSGVSTLFLKCRYRRCVRLAVRNVLSIIILSIIVLNLNAFADDLANDLKPVSAYEVMKLIRKGKALNLDSVLIKDDLRIWDGGLTELEIDGIKRKAVKSKIFITNSIISGNVDFSGVLFVNKVTLINVRFKSEVDFSGVFFQKWASLFGVHFKNNSNFESSHFAGKVWFYNVRFWREANFAGAIFRENATFSGTQFNGLAKFNEATFDAETKFSHCEFKDSVDFTQIRVQSIRISWNQIERRLKFDSPAYSVLIKNFKEFGQFEDADNAYYEYKVRKRVRMTSVWYNPLNSLEYIFLDFACGYGTKPFWAVRFSILLIFLFSFAYIWNDAIKERDGSVRIQRNIAKRFGNALYFSVITFTTVGFGDWYPAKKYSKFFAMIEGFLGWIMLSLFLITLARTWIR
jgi:uncharacterized protein YjbI with pentapeptide repeats